MAQKEKYTDDQLMAAVMKYAEAVPGKIFISKLAAWTRNNMEGMEGVQEHNFRGMRKIPGEDKKSPVPAYGRILAINEARKLAGAMKSNRLLSAANPDEFLADQPSSQRRQVLEARETVETLFKDNANLRQETDRLRAENAEMKARAEELDRELAGIRKKQEALDRRLALLVNLVDEELRKKALEQIGIVDGGFDLAAHVQSLHEDISMAFSISGAMQPAMDALDAGMGMDEIMGGIDFG